MTSLLCQLISSFNPDDPRYPPTDLYNEGWLLRLTLDWFSRSTYSGHPLSFAGGSVWYSEARLPSAFLRRKGFRPDPLAEGHTSVDGAIGQFNVGRSGKTDLVLREGACHLTILEAKLFSDLSKDVTNAPGFDQAARTVACIAEVLHRANIEPEAMSSIGYFLLAPREKIEEDRMAALLDKRSIERKVRQRVEAYGGEKDAWLQAAFLPLMDSIKIGAISWEEVVDLIERTEPDAGRQFAQYYHSCLKYTAPAKARLSA